MPDDEPSAGHVVAERYRLVKKLGEGGMGEVWLADHVTLHSQVAIKLLHREVLGSEDGLKRFLREAQAAAKLRSPHVVQILEHGVDAGVPFIAMELLEGESLATRLARLSTLSLAQTARIVTHVARAIGKAHEAGIVHRDLKPDNIFIVRNDDEEVVKVLDFGIAKMETALAETAAKISTQEGSLLGTPHYMSPEQVRGYGVDWRSDLWALGMIAFECVCGRLPFEGRSVGDILVMICSEPLPVPSTLRPLPPSFDAWFAKAASRDLEARFQSAKEMAEALRAVAGEESRTPMPDSARVLGGGARDDARTLDAATPLPVSARTELERARTVSSGGTMGGAATSADVRPGRKSARLIAGGVLAGAVALVAWFGLTSRTPSNLSGGASSTKRATTTVVTPSATVSVNVTSAVASTQTVPDTSSTTTAMPSVTAAASTSAHTVRSATPTATSRPSATPTTKPASSDDLLY